MQNSKHYLIVDGPLAFKHKIRVKTRPASWMNDNQPIIVPLSIHATMFREEYANQKLFSILSLLDGLAQRKVTVLICEGAHLHCLNMNAGNIIETTRKATQHANAFLNRFKHELEGFETISWLKLVNQYSKYNEFREFITNLYKNDPSFRTLVQQDAAHSYLQHADAQHNKQLFLECCELDLLEQCAYLLVVAHLGYRYELYPGKRIACANYINTTILEKKNAITRINVTIGTPKIYSSNKKTL